MTPEERGVAELVTDERWLAAVRDTDNMAMERLIATACRMAVAAERERWVSVLVTHSPRIGLWFVDDPTGEGHSDNLVQFATRDEAVAYLLSRVPEGRP